MIKTQIIYFCVLSGRSNDNENMDKESNQKSTRNHKRTKFIVIVSGLWRSKKEKKRKKEKRGRKKKKKT